MNYTTIKALAKASFIEKRSEFIGYLCPVSTNDEAVNFINNIKAEHRKAKHNVYAYILRDNNITRYSDDGEPQGTAGIPVLDVLQKHQLTDICCVVTRYFGGILLGGGGLVRAYQKSVQEGLAASVIIDKKEGRRLSVGTDYTGLGKLQYLVAQNGLTLIDTVYTEKVELLLMVPSEMQEQTEKEIIEATNGKADISWGEMVLYAMVEGKLQIF